MNIQKTIADNEQLKIENKDYQNYYNVIIDCKEKRIVRKDLNSYWISVKIEFIIQKLSKILYFDEYSSLISVQFPQCYSKIL